MQNLRVQGETKERLNECDHWCQSCYFTEREKAVLNLSQAVSLHECEEQSTQILKDARRHFNIHEIVWLTLAVMAVNDWIDLQENWPEHCLQF